MKLIFSTHNKHKLEEVKAMLPSSFNLLGLDDIGWSEDIPEPYHTFVENATTKAQTIFDKMGHACFADDSGLEVEALDLAPGVFSARYAGESCSAEDNVEKLLHNLGNETNRKARFKTVIVLIINNEVQVFEGAVDGIISTRPIGSKGFGYDPVFVPSGQSRTFAQMEPYEKNKLSHRFLALQKMIQYLHTLEKNC